MNNPENYSEAEQQASEPDFYGKWVSVNSRLPKDHVTVLAYGESARSDVFMAFMSGDEWLDNEDCETIVGITHWMDKPSIPETESNTH